MKKNLLLTLVLALFAWSGMMAGTGTVNDPYSVADVIAIGNDIPAGTYVIGYIVGGRYDDFDYDGNVYGISIADLATETDVNNCVQVKLASDMRDMWHPQNDSTLIGKMIIASGSGDGYGGYPALENNVTIEFYTPPVAGAPMIADVMPTSGSVYILDEEFNVSATVTTEDAAGIDSVCLAYGDSYDGLTDTILMSADADLYSVELSIDEVGSKYGQVIAYGANGEMATSSTIEVIAQDFLTFDMEKALYQVIVDTVNARGDNSYYSPEKQEDYYGASANYNNFSAGDGSYSASFEHYNVAIEEALSTILLPAIRPSAVVEDTFMISYKLYGADANEGSMEFVCTAVSPLTFTYIGDDLIPPTPMLSSFSMDSLDYQILVDYSNDNSLNTLTSYTETGENYFGASSYHENFTVSDGSFDASFITADSAIQSALTMVLIPAKFPELVVSDTFEIEYKMYGGESAIGSMVFLCTSVDPLAFESITLEEVIETSREVVMSTSDFQIIVDTVTARGNNTHSYPGNSEDYYGAAAFYTNFAIASGDYNAIFSSPEAAIVEAISTILLPAIRPLSAVNDTFDVSYNTWDGSSAGAETMTFVCTSTDPLTFEYTGELPASLVNVQDLNVSLYPNPATASIQLTAAADKVTFINISGRTVMSVQNVAAHSTIDVSSLNTGLYFVKVDNSEGTVLSRLIKK